MKWWVADKQITARERSKLITKAERKSVVDTMLALYGGIVAPSELVKKPRGFGKKSTCN